MPKDSYNPSGTSNVEPLEAGQYTNCVLERIYAFRQKQKDDNTGQEFIRTKLSLYWNSGYAIPDSEEPFYLTDGFVTFSFHERANFTKMLSTLGFLKVGEPVEFEYELAGDYVGRAFDALPIYEGTGPKKDVEVPVDSLRINDRELIGTTATLIVSVKDSGFNKIDLVLRDAPKAPTRPGPRRIEGSDSGKAEAPVNVPARKAAQRKGEPLWLTWRTKNAAVKWAATLRNSDGSPAYTEVSDAESVWHALRITFDQEVFEPSDREFYWHWFRWHEKALADEDFSFHDEPTLEDQEFLYEVRGRHA